MHAPRRGTCTVSRQNRPTNSRIALGFRQLGESGLAAAAFKFPNLYQWFGMPATRRIQHPFQRIPRLGSFSRVPSFRLFSALGVLPVR